MDLWAENLQLPYETVPHVILRPVTEQEHLLPLQQYRVQVLILKVEVEWLLPLLPD
jgi:hypothetical protein